MIKNLIFRVYLLISDFLVENLKANNTSKNDHSFYNAVSLKKPLILRTSTDSNYQIITLYSCNTAKNLFLVGVRKNDILHCTISRRPRTAFSEHSKCKCLYIPVYHRSNIFVSKTSEVFIWWGWGGRGSIINFRQIAVWDS